MMPERCLSAPMIVSLRGQNSLGGESEMKSQCEKIHDVADDAKKMIRDDLVSQ